MTFYDKDSLIFQGKYDWHTFTPYQTMTKSVVYSISMSHFNSKIILCQQQKVFSSSRINDSQSTSFVYYSLAYTGQRKHVFILKISFWTCVSYYKIKHDKYKKYYFDPQKKIIKLYYF